MHKIMEMSGCNREVAQWSRESYSVLRISIRQGDHLTVQDFS
ncbi:MAG: hypothetical protein U9N40_06190 [Euryarchaeota archaeon]|nr:hypothetical protein [Euryarchaeota archaeon]